MAAASQLWRSTTAALQLRRRRRPLHRSSGGRRPLHCSSGGVGDRCIAAPAVDDRCTAAPAASTTAASQLRRHRCPLHRSSDGCCIATPAPTRPLLPCGACLERTVGVVPAEKCNPRETKRTATMFTIRQLSRRRITASYQPAYA
ncbi:hypothetical protein VPH35_118924 [Triticum aestivum]